MGILSTVVFAGGSSGGFVQGIIFLFVVVIILGLLLWLVSIAPFIPALFKQVLSFIIYFVAVLVLINFLLGLCNHAFITY